MFASDHRRADNACLESSKPARLADGALDLAPRSLDGQGLMLKASGAHVNFVRHFVRRKERGPTRQASHNRR
jgi:hypothetical protein